MTRTLATVTAAIDPWYPLILPALVLGTAWGFESPREALPVAALLALSIFGVRWLVQAKTHLGAFTWFKLYPLRAAFVVLLTTIAAVMIVVHFGPSSAIQMPLVFYWFWMFAAIPTSVRGRTSNEA